MREAPVPAEASLTDSPTPLPQPTQPEAPVAQAQRLLGETSPPPVENKTLSALKAATDTVVAFIKSKRDTLEEEQASHNIDALRCRIHELTARCDAMNRRWQIHERRDLEREVAGMQADIEGLESREALVAFDRDSRRFITAFRDMVEQQKAKELVDALKPPKEVKKRKRAQTKVRRRHVTKPELHVLTFGEANAVAFADAFMERHGGGELTQRPMCSLSNDTCAICAGQLKHDAQVDMLICQCCQNEQSSIHSNVNIGYSNAGSMNLSACRYRRVAHFTAQLNKFQGAGSEKVTPEVLDRVMGWLRKHKVPERKVNTKYVEKALENLGLKDYSGLVFVITSQITGKPLPKFSPDEMSQLISMFLRVDDAFERLQKQGAFPHRVNFLSYHFCIYKFLELLTWGGRKYMRHFSVLKGRENLAKSDLDWRICCEAVNLRFISTV